MDAKQIEDIFYKSIEKRGVSNNLEGISKDVIYHWRNKSRSVSIGDMLNVLYQLKLIEIKVLEQKPEIELVKFPDRKTFDRLINNYWEPIPYILQDSLFTGTEERVLDAEEAIMSFLEEIKYACKLNNVNVWITHNYFASFQFYLVITTPIGIFKKESRPHEIINSVEEILKILEPLKQILKDEFAR